MVSIDAVGQTAESTEYVGEIMHLLLPGLPVPRESPLCGRLGIEQGREFCRNRWWGHEAKRMSCRGHEATDGRLLPGIRARRLTGDLARLVK